ncbi:MAG: sel1 repeat family protein, partial [Alphaproteobacteria bacterium]
MHKMAFAAGFLALLVMTAPAYPAADTETPYGQYQQARALASQADGLPTEEARAKQYAEVASLYRKAASQGYPAAQYDLGQLLYDGLVVKKDYKEAFKWFDKAARQGIHPAQFYTGLCYQLGLGTKQNDAEAYFWLTLAQKGGWQ